MMEPRVEAVRNCLCDWNCFEPLAPGALDRLAESVVAAIERVDAGSAAEAAWLVEMKAAYGRPAYWTAAMYWTGDHMLALRFARRLDAERVIGFFGWTKAHAVEHAWGP